MIDKQLLQKRFSKQAVVYDKYAVVQKKMADTLLEILCEEQALHKQESLHILEIGCGTGELTERLCRLFPKAEITAVDLAPGMIYVAEKRPILKERVHFLCADIETIHLDAENYDLIVSNATVQWLNHLPQTIHRLYDALKSDGMILFSTFLSNTFYELHKSHALSVTKDYNPPRLGPDFYEKHRLLKDLSEEIQQVDLTLHEAKIYEYFPNVRLFLRSIQRIGATNSKASQVPIRPSFFRRLFREYETNFKSEAGIRVTYHVGNVQLRK